MGFFLRLFILYFILKLEIMNVKYLFVDWLGSLMVGYIFIASEFLGFLLSIEKLDKYKLKVLG